MRIPFFSVKWVIIFLYLLILLLFPLFALVNKTGLFPSFFSSTQTSFFLFWKIASQPLSLSAYKITFLTAFFACVINTFFGFLVAWMLVRYQFFGKRFVDAAIDLPFSLPTSVAGLTLATVYGQNGWIGSYLEKVGIHIIFNSYGIILAMIFVSFPFIVRTLQPVLQEIEKETEEAAWSLGASSWKTFQTIIFPSLIPALLTGMTLAFSRSIGEYGSILIVAANIPFQDLIASVLIYQKLEQYDILSATIIGMVMLLLSIVLLLLMNFFQNWNKKY